MSQATRWAVVAAMICSSGPGESRGEGPERPGYAPIAEALAGAKATGRPAIVVVTSGDRAEPARLRDQLPALLRARRLDRVATLAELDAEADPGLAARLNVKQAPTVVVYGGSGDGGPMELIGHQAGEADPFAILGWLTALLGDRLTADDAIEPASAASAPADPAVDRVQYATGQYPTPQQPPAYTPPPAAPPAYEYPQYQQYPQVQAVPTYQAPQPIYVTPPTAPIVVQPPTQTIVMAPAPGPNIVFAGAPSAAPTISMAPTGGAPVSMAPPAAPNVLMAPSQPAPAPVAMAPAPSAPVSMAPSAPVSMAPVSMAPAAQPMMMAPVAAAPVSMAPTAQPVMMAPVAAAPVSMAPTAQPVMMAPVAAAPAVGQGPLTTAAITIIAPRLLDRLIGSLGEHLAERRQPRVRISEAPSMLSLAPSAAAFAAAPAALAASPAAFAAAPAALAAAPAAAAMPCPGVPAAQPCGHGLCHSCQAEAAHGHAYAPPPPYPAPSPQAAGPPHKSFFRR